MDRHEAMTTPHGDFISGIRPVLNPVFRIVDCMLDVHRDSVCLDADVARSRPILSGPAPHVIEHATMEISQKALIEEIVLTPGCPPNGRGNMVMYEGMSPSRSSIASGVFASSSRAKSWSAMDVLLIPETS